jgi:5-methylcytosine-specific restriction endonuclease McrA
MGVDDGNPSRPDARAVVSRYTLDARWKRVRRAKLAATPTCERCPEPATDVHHVDERGLDGQLAYAIENTEALCHSCHSKQTARFGVGRKVPRKRPREPHPGLLAPGGEPQ